MNPLRLRLPPKKLIRLLPGLLVLGAGLVQAAAAAPRRPARQNIVVSNRTYTPLWYRYRGTSGRLSNWSAVLPGRDLAFPNRSRVEIHVSQAGRPASYTLRSGDQYAYRRRPGAKQPQLVQCRARARSEWMPPQPPTHFTTSQEGSATLFGPLTEFIDRSEQSGHEYRLSLKELAVDCLLAQRQGEIPENLRHLEGFTWFFGYMVDRQNDDVILLGVKDPTKPPIDLDNLATAIEAVHYDQVPACSLDAHPNPKYQKSVVRGVPWNTLWAEIMINADYDMKRVGQGHLDPRIAGLKSSFDRQLDDGRRDHSLWKVGTTANRWWFNFDSDTDRSAVSQRGDLVVLYRNPVRISTEKEVGGRYGTGTTDFYALRFANDFTHYMNTLSMHYPSVARLEALYRLYDLLYHLKHVSRATPPASEYWLSVYEHPYAGPPLAVPTLIRKKEVDDVTGRYTLSSKVSGGVSMRLQVNEKNLRRGAVQNPLRCRISSANPNLGSSSQD